MELYYNKIDIIEKLSKIESSYEDILDRADDVYNSYVELMSNEFYADAGRATQESIIDQAINQIAKLGNTREQFMNFKSAQIGGIEHMEFYSHFLGDEEAVKLQNAMRSAGVDFSILKGVKAKEFGFDSLPSKDGSERVDIEWASINGSPQVVYMEVFKNGKSVYVYGKQGTLPDFAEDAAEIGTVKRAPTLAEKAKDEKLIAVIEHEGNTYREKISTFTRTLKSGEVRTYTRIYYFDENNNFVSGRDFQ